MATKAMELHLLGEGQGCLGKAAFDEPIFILRAKDDSAPSMVRQWAKRQIELGSTTPKIAEAMELADLMEAWQLKNGSHRAD